MVSEPLGPITLQAPEVDELTRNCRAPWVNCRVLIHKIGHPLKGYIGRIKDAIRPANKDEKPKVVVQLERRNAVGATQAVFFYDEVIDCAYVVFVVDQPCVLMSFRSGGRLPCDFPEDHPFYFIVDTPSSPPRRPISLWPNHFPFTPANQATTPAWSSTDLGYVGDFGSTPAWDPTHDWSLIPPSSDEASAPPSASTSALPPATLAHPLLDTRLVGKTVRVTVTGGEHPKKDTTITIVSDNGVPSMRQQWYRTILPLRPEWVEMKHPHPTRDNGLLVVIKGEHCGKYVRRIEHRYGAAGAIIKVAVVEHAEKTPDRLTGEQFELMADDLCLGSETTADRKKNDQVMQGLRYGA